MGVGQGVSPTAAAATTTAAMNIRANVELGKYTCSPRVTSVTDVHLNRT